MTIETEPTEAPLLAQPLPIELMNTIWADRDGVHDALRDATRCAHWLASVAQLLGDPPVTTIAEWHLTTRDVSSLRLLRDAIRRLAAIACADDRERAASPVADQQTAVHVLNDAAAAAPRWRHLSWPPGAAPIITQVSSGSAFEMALSNLSETAARLFVGPERENIRACQAPGCVLYFIRDHPRRRWCSDACGNRARVARHYRSHRPNSLQTPDTTSIR